MCIRDRVRDVFYLNQKLQTEFVATNVGAGDGSFRHGMNGSSK